MRPLLLAMFMAARSSSRAMLTWLQKYYLLRLETKLALGTSSQFFNHILRLPAAYFGQRFAGEIGSRVLINDKVAKIVSGKLATTVIDSVMTVFYAALMFFYDVSLTLVVIGHRPAQRRARSGSPAALRDRRQPPPDAGQGQAAGHGDERSADDRDHQGDRIGGRVLRAVGRLLRQDRQQRAVPAGARPDRRPWCRRSCRRCPRRRCSSSAASRS